MLILTRRQSEAVVIGNHIEITVLGVKGNQVRLGIDAPKNVTVHRKEIYSKIYSEEPMLSHEAFEEGDEHTC